MFDNLGRPGRVLLLGGTSEIGLAILAALRAPADTEVVLAGRDEQRMVAAGNALPFRTTTLAFEALKPGSHQAAISGVFAGGPVDLVIAATGVLIAQEHVDRDPALGAEMVDVNFASHVTTLLAAASRMRSQRYGTIVVLSSVAAIRPRKANYVYGAAKAGLDAFARGLTDALAGTGVRVLLVRPGFVTGRMTAGLPPAPMSSTPAEVGSAVAAALDGKASLLWVPRGLAAAAAMIRLVPRPLWRRMRR